MYQSTIHPPQVNPMPPLATSHRINHVEMRGIVKRFPGVLANAGVNLDVYAGEVHSLLGENGAGKSTLMRQLYGMYQPNEGQILIDDVPHVFHSPADAIRAGIGVIPRRLAVFEQLSVAENIAVGNWQNENRLFINRSQTRRRADEILRELDLALDPSMKAGGLSGAQKRLLTIARALSTRPRVLVLDEPASTVSSPAEMSQLIRVLRWAAGQGIASLYLTTRVAEVLLVADRATVLRDGVGIGDFERAGLDEAVLTRLMISQRPGGARDFDEDERAGPGGLVGTLRSFFKGQR